MKGNEQLKEYGKRLRLYHLCNHMDELLHVAQQEKTLRRTSAAKT